MKRIINFNIIVSLFLSIAFYSCNKEYGSLNGPAVEDYLKNASKDQLNGLVTGSLSGMRINDGIYLDAVGIIGREMYRFSIAEPRYVTELLGSENTTLSNNGFYLVNPWSSRYRAVKNCNVLIDAATNSTLITDDERNAYFGFAKTLKAFELLLNLNLTYHSGIRVDVADPNNIGPVLGYDESIAAIASLLDEGYANLNGATVAFQLPDGAFTGLDDAAGLAKFNRALAARVAIYRQQWTEALTDLDQSFFNLHGDFYAGAYEVFSTSSGDILNPAFFPQNQSGDVRIAHPSYVPGLQPGDDRISKATKRDAVASNSGLSSDRDVWVYRSSTAPIPIVRNEELILIYAEAKIQTNELSDAVDALNVIRNGHNLPDYSGAMTQGALIDEMLYERRYSLFYEGHRWIDMRRYNRLDQLPIDRPNDDVWAEFPLPLTEL